MSMSGPDRRVIDVSAAPLPEAVDITTPAVLSIASALLALSGAAKLLAKCALICRDALPPHADIKRRRLFDF